MLPQDQLHPRWIDAPNPGFKFILMPKYNVTVTKIYQPETSTEEALKLTVDTEAVYAQTFPESEFDINSLIMALNKRRRVRKARGKEAV